MEKHFANLKLIDSDPDYKLTRAASFSELPSARRVCVEKSYKTEDSSGLVRQYSCEHIYDKLSNTRELKISKVVRSGNNELEHIWRTTVNDWSSQRQPTIPTILNNEVEYMEVDDIDSTTHQTHLPCPEIFSKSKETPVSQVYKEPIEIKDLDPVIPGKNKEENKFQDKKEKVLRPLVPKVNIEEKKRNMCTVWFCIVPIALLSLAIFMVPDEFSEGVCGWQSNFSAANLELQLKVHGQGKAIQELTNYLREDSSFSKIIALVGGTGVGKSYTAEIISNHFPHKQNIFIRMPVLKSTIHSSELSSRYPNLVIFENLVDTNLPDIIPILVELQSLKNHCVTIITIFNMERVDKDLTRTVDLASNVERIHASFQKENIPAIIIPFEPLDEQVIEMCIKDAAEDNYLELNNIQIDRLKKSLLASNTGCKKVYAQVQVMARE